MVIVPNQSVVEAPPPDIAQPRPFQVELPKSRWVQDPAVRDLIKHMDAEERYDNWSALTRDELKAVEGEINKCRKDFVYAARNYFWIIDDRGQEALFGLWDSQELIYQRMLDLKAQGKPQKVVIIKSRRLGCSTLIEALIAWKSIFHTGVNAVVVSYDRDHTKDLFGIMANIYDKLPWWIKPRYSSRTFEAGLIFDNPDDTLRRIDPGNMSRVMVKSANAISGVGQGYRISAAHLSEWSSYDPWRARQIIEEDLKYALEGGTEVFAFLESTAKGANTFSHEFWKRCEALGDESDWSPLFLPWFVDRRHFRKPIPGQIFDKELFDMRARAEHDWVRCDNCLRFFNRWIKNLDQSEEKCRICKSGSTYPLKLVDDQLAWMQYLIANTRGDEKSQKLLAQEQAGTAEDAFQVSGYQVFGKTAQDFANVNVRHPLLTGFLDRAGRIHAVDPKYTRVTESGQIDPASCRCIIEDCKENHLYDFCPLRIWEYPTLEDRYYIGADVSEGLGGNCDYSVASVIKMSVSSQIGPTHQVAVWRSNRTSPQDFAEQINVLGRLYNECEVSVEVNRYDTAATWLRTICQYPNLYRWKHMDSINVMSNKIGWFTNQQSRPRLHQNFRRFLEYKMFFVRSSITAEEMKNFVKDDYDDRVAGADSDTHDDELFATMMALWCAYEGHYDDSRGYIPIFKDNNDESAELKYTCKGCGAVWFSNTPPQDHDYGFVRCEKCKSIRISMERNRMNTDPGMDPEKIYDEVFGSESGRSAGKQPEYFEL